MTIKQYTYLDIPRQLRAQRAGDAMRQLQETLASPFVTEEQREAVQRQRERLQQWAAGTLPEPPTRAPVPEAMEESELVALAAPLTEPDVESGGPESTDHTVKLHEKLEASDSTP